MPPQHNSSQARGVRRPNKTASCPPTGMVGAQTLSAHASSCTRFPDAMSLDGMSGNQVQDDTGGVGLGGGGQTTEPGKPWPAQPIMIDSRPLPQSHPIFVKVALTVHPHPRGKAGLHKSWVGLGCSTAQLPKPPPLNHSRALSQVRLKEKQNHWLRVTGVVRAGTGS